MKKYFDELIIDKAVKHAKSVWPEEGCGFIVEDDFIPIENISKEKIMTFEIDVEEYIKYSDIKCLIHSHDNFPHASKKDMLQQIATAVPWGIIFLKNKAVEGMVFFGDQLPPQDLVGRPFYHGVHDCYALVRDYYRMEKDITIPIFPRDNLWWEKEPSMLLDGFGEAGFEQIDESEVEEGDVFFAQVRANVVNHSGIVLKNGVILHHLYNRLSRREPIYNWKDYITGYYRYTGGK